MNKRLLKKIDFGLILIVLFLCIIGVIMVDSATMDLQSTRFMKTQIISIFMGLMAVIFLLLFDYSFFEKLFIPIYILCNSMLVAVLVVGKGQEQWGADRWIRIGGFGFQPSDFVKIGVIICLAKIITDHKDSIHEPRTLFKILGFVGLPMTLILAQPDLGTTMAFAAFTFGILFIAGLKYKHILIAGIIGILSMPIAWIGLKDYQKKRIMVFLDPNTDPSGSGYHILQSKLSIGSGRLLGKGLYNGNINKYGFLPEKHTDFIFAVLVEELGFLGAGILIFLYFFMLLRCIRIAKTARDDFGKYLVVGFTCMLIFHIFANIAMTIGLMPVTGKPLPFISYGGTFMLSNMIAIGIILNVNMRRDKINF